MFATDRPPAFLGIQLRRQHHSFKFPQKAGQDATQTDYSIDEQYCSEPSTAAYSQAGSIGQERQQTLGRSTLPG
jgi:hypothetical protein